MSYDDIAEAIKVAEERQQAGFVGCVTVRLETLRLWRTKMLIAADQPAETLAQAWDRGWDAGQAYEAFGAVAVPGNPYDAAAVEARASVRLDTETHCLPESGAESQGARPAPAR